MKKLLAILICVLLLVPHITNAADTQLFVSGPSAASVGSTFTVHLKVSSTNAVNTVEGHVSYPTELLQAVSTRKGASILKLWPEDPSVNNNTGVVSFTGGLPNPGFSGSSGQLVDVTFKALAEGTATISFTSGSQVLLNDGQGTAASWNSGPLRVNIAKPVPTKAPAKDKPVVPTEPTEPIIPADTTPPTDLELLIGRDSYLFNGDWFAVFQATDEDSDIDYYEIAEIDINQRYPEDYDWHSAKSPYRLIRQNENTRVFLKAVDNAGNAATISRTHLIQPLKKNNLIYIVYILLGIIALLLTFNFYQKLSQRRKDRK